jgi:hypothetical protein
MNKIKDLTGKKFGRLEAIKIVEPKIRRDKRSYWLCICDCGNKSIVSVSHLMNGRTKSCGCYRKEIASINGIKHQSNLKPLDVEKVMIGVKKNCVFDTSLNALSKTLLSNNTSGVKGVVWDKSRNKWQAKIEFQKKRYFLGRFSNKEDAIKVRKQAEEMLFEPFLKWYEEFKNINI